MARRPRFLSIRLKLLGLIAGILLASLAVHLALALRLMRDDRLTYAFALSQTVARGLAAQVAQTLEHLHTELSFSGALVLAEPPAMREALARRLLDANPDLVRLTFLLTERHGDPPAALSVVAPARLVHLGLSEGDLTQLDASTPLPLAEAAAKGAVLVNRSLPPAAQLFTVVVAGPRDVGEPRWYVAADLRQGPLLAIFQATPIDAAYLVDAHGRVVTHPDPERVVARASLAQRPIVAAALAASESAADGAAGASGKDGTPRVAAYARVGNSSMWVIAEIERVTALAASRRFIHLSMLFGVAMTLAAFLLSIWFARRLTRPIGAVRDAMARLAAGRFDVPPVTATHDEIGQLGADFEAMAGKLRHSQMKLIESERLATLGLVGAGISHDVKNPLTGIIGFAELALMDVSRTHDVEDYLRNIHQAALKATDIIRDFLTYARQGVDAQRVDFNAVVASGLRMVLFQLRSSKMQVHESYGATPPVRVKAGQIQQVIMNLAVNAQQASGKGGNLTIATRTLAGGQAEVEVRDDGPGIPTDIIARIFDPFFTTKPASTGLGLAVCRQIVEEHGGKLTVESASARGATFRFWLPPDEATG